MSRHRGVGQGEENISGASGEPGPCPSCLLVLIRGAPVCCPFGAVRLVGWQTHSGTELAELPRAAAAPCCLTERTQLG